jgi:hypothetical protein
MELENIILSEPSQIQKTKDQVSSYMWNIKPIKHKQYYIHTHKHTQYVHKNGTGRKEEENKERKIVNNNEIQHICVEARHNETH